MVWDILGFFLDVGGSWELVALGTFIFVVLSLVKVAESEGTSISVRENYLTLFLVVFVGSVSFYQNDEVKTIVDDTNIIVKEIRQEQNESKRLRSDLKRERKKYDKLEKEFYALRKSVKEKASNSNEIIDNANEILEKNGMESAIFYLKFQLSSLKHLDKSRLDKSEKLKPSDEGLESIKETNSILEVNEINTTDSFMMDFIDKTVEIDGLIYENIPFSKKYTWNEANTYCSEKDEMNKEWRLPTRKELNKISNIVMYGDKDDEWKDWFTENKNKRLKNSRGRISFTRKEFLENMKVFPWFWTNEPKSDILIWVVRFDGGHNGWDNLTNKFYVLCVSEK